VIGTELAARAPAVVTRAYGWRQLPITQRCVQLLIRHPAGFVAIIHSDRRHRVCRASITAVKSIKDLVDLAKLRLVNLLRNAGVGVGQHFAGEMFNWLPRINIV